MLITLKDALSIKKNMKIDTEELIECLMIVNDEIGNRIINFEKILTVGLKFKIEKSETNENSISKSNKTIYLVDLKNKNQNRCIFERSFLSLIDPKVLSSNNINLKAKKKWLLTDWFIMDFNERLNKLEGRYWFERRMEVADSLGFTLALFDNELAKYNYKEQNSIWLKNNNKEIVIQIEKQNVMNIINMLTMSEINGMNCSF